MPKQDFNSGMEDKEPHREGGMNKNAGMGQDGNDRMAKDKNAEMGKKNKSVLIGKRHSDMEMEDKH